MKALGHVSFYGKEIQKDIFFEVPKGRLKLRRINSAKCQLIPYLRTDQAGPKQSDYTLLQSDDPDSAEDLLSRILSVHKCVEKEREIYLYRNVRIHLDKVRNLGQFIEFEAVVADPAKVEENRSRIYDLLEHFKIGAEDLIDCAYVDLLEDQPDKKEKDGI
jgi:predicted adenylyl cyclase CyaB